MKPKIKPRMRLWAGLNTPPLHPEPKRRSRLISIKATMPEIQQLGHLLPHRIHRRRENQKENPSQMIQIRSCAKKNVTVLVSSKRVNALGEPKIALTTTFRNNHLKRQQQDLNPGVHGAQRPETIAGAGLQHVATVPEARQWEKTKRFADSI